jgi:hypothetical protein
MADVAEPERPQKRAERRRRVDPVEQLAPPAVQQLRQIIDRISAGDHPRDQRGDLCSAWTPLSVATLNDRSTWGLRFNGDAA